MHYVIGDVHGCFDDLMRLLDKIEKQDSKAKIIFVGDFIDRGPDVLKTLNWFMENITAKGKYQCVLGNHEDMILDWYTEYVHWLSAGWKNSHNPPSTHFDFSDSLKKAGLLEESYVTKVIAFFRRLPLRKKVVVKTAKGKKLTYLIAHAWDEENPHNSAEYRRYINLWERKLGGNHYDDKIVVHGHTPTVLDEYIRSGHVAPGLIGYRQGDINLDGGGVFGKYNQSYPCMIGAICLETLEEFYPYTIEERLAMLNSDYSCEEVQALVDAYKDIYMSQENPYRKDMLERLQN